MTSESLGKQDIIHSFSTELFFLNFDTTYIFTLIDQIFRKSCNLGTMYEEMRKGIYIVVVITGITVFDFYCVLLYSFSRTACFN